MMGEGLPDLTERLRINRRRQRVRHVLPVVLVLLLLAAAVAGVVVVRMTPVLDVRQVEVQGTTLVSHEQVRERAAVTLGTPLAGVDSQQVAARVGTLVPVEGVRVIRSWPHTLQIRITERTPVVQRRSGGDYQWVDAHGVIFHTSGRSDPKLVTVTTGSVDNDLLGDVATVVQSLPAALRRALASVSALTRNSITLHLRDGRLVVWGGSDQSELKGEVATGLLKIDARVYDVSSPANPTSR